MLLSVECFRCSHSPGGVAPPPRWSCLLCALGLFVYQSLDSIDGKQARRTNTSSPLGELFDHGCDSISTVFVALSACISCQLGHYPNWLFFQVLNALLITIPYSSMKLHNISITFFFRMFLFFSASVPSVYSTVPIGKPMSQVLYVSVRSM